MAVTDQEARAWVGRTRQDPPGEIVCERGFLESWCEATENANPMWWDPETARRIAGHEIAPPSMLSAWMRPRHWRPDRTEAAMPLSLHFDLKKALGLPEGIVRANEIRFGVPVRVGDRITTTQTVRDVGKVRTTRLGTGRDWTIDVTYANQRGEIVGVESYVMFGYTRSAT